MKRMSMNDTIFTVFNLILATFFMLVCLYPLYFVVIASFSNVTQVTTGKVWLWPVGFNLDGYKRMLQYSDIWSGYLNTIIYTICGTAINMGFTLTAAFALSRRTMPFRKAINLYFILTMFISGGLVPTYLLMNNLKLTNTFTIIILLGGVNVWNIIICRTFFENGIPDDILEASQIDGCSDARYFFQILLPLSKAIIAVLILFFAVQHWNSYFNAMIYLRNPDRFPLQLVLRNILLETSLTGETSDSGMDQILQMQSIKYGVIIVSSVPVLVLYPFIQKHFVKGVMIGAIKG